MPKAPSSSPVKSDPYDKASPTKQRAVVVKGVSWTDDMDRDLISYVLSISDINLRYNWPDLQKNKFPGLTPKQLKSRWDNKLKNSLFPPEVMKLSKEAKSKKESSANAEGSE